jgi:DNA-binding transcriptional regulator YdaS (Cro superfamily)
MTPQQALSQAVNRIGSQAAMGRLLGVSQAAVWKWLEEGMALPAEHVLKVERATNVLRHDLRPDLYPRGLQDDVPFNPDGGSATADDLPLTPPPEWPIAGAHGESAENSEAEFQAAGGAR